MVRIDVDDVLEPYDYQIEGLYFKKDRRYNQRDGFYISVWDGFKWLFIEKLIPTTGNIKKIMLRAGKETLGQILSVDYKKVHPNTNLPDLEGELFKAGDLVYDSKHNAVGVVLGCVNDERGELRLDSDGMVSQEYLRFATLEDVEREGTFVGKGLYEQIKKEYHEKKEKNNA